MELRKMTGLEQQMTEDLRWAVNAPEVQHHVNKLVIVYKKQVLAVGTELDKLLEEAAALAGCPQEHLLVVPVPDPWFDPGPDFLDVVE